VKRAAGGLVDLGPPPDWATHVCVRDFEWDMLWAGEWVRDVTNEPDFPGRPDYYDEEILNNPIYATPESDNLPYDCYVLCRRECRIVGTESSSVEDDFFYCVSAFLMTVADYVADRERRWQGREDLFREGGEPSCVR
jgi:hypothetical protein